MSSARQMFRIEGLKELDAALKELPKATARTVLRNTLKKEAQPIADAAAALAPDDPETGGNDLKSSIRVLSSVSRAGREMKENDVEVYVGPTSKAFHGMFQEFGTANHGPQPFLRPAWDSNVMRVLAGIRDRLAEEIERARQRLAKKAARIAAKLNAQV